jgi:hypothetical protein
VKLFLCLIQQYVPKMYEGVKAQFLAFLTSEVDDDIHTSAALTPSRYLLNKDVSPSRRILGESLTAVSSSVGPCS